MWKSYILNITSESQMCGNLKQGLSLWFVIDFHVDAGAVDNLPQSKA